MGLGSPIGPKKTKLDLSFTGMVMFFLSACGDFLDLSSWEYQMQKSSEIIEGEIGEIPLGLKRESPRGDPLELLVEIRRRSVKRKTWLTRADVHLCLNKF